MSVSRLIYISTARERLDKHNLEDILTVARSANAKAGVTGFLLYNGSNFMQALEGPAQAVTDTFDRICQDDRHHGVVRILLEDDVEREFADWSMGYSEIHDCAETAFQIKSGQLESQLPPEMSQDLRMLFVSFNTMPGLQTRTTT